MKNGVRIGDAVGIVASENRNSDIGTQGIWFMEIGNNWIEIRIHKQLCIVCFRSCKCGGIETGTTWIQAIIELKENQNKKCKK